MTDPTVEPGPDVSVRLGWADDAAGIAAVQVRSWRASYAGLLPPDVLADLDADAFAATWHEALAHPKNARERVLVALERNTIRGFVVTGPSPDPDADPAVDGEIVELAVDPDHTRSGHGSRLVHAAVDTLRADGLTHVAVWLAAADDVRRAFLAEAGWAPDGAHRELDLHGDGTVLVKQVRLHTDLSS
ncbi:MAG: GNAT family N-acetyltransferase [Nocardioidaceae bacterium]